MSDILNLKECEILTNEPLHKYSYMKTGGVAENIIFPLSSKAFINAVKTIDAYVFGNCSNVIFSDDGIKKPIILTTKLKNITVEEDDEYVFITADTGASLSSVSRTALANSACGLEFAHGIPGTVGGAVFMNAGAYDGEIKDVFHSCICLDEHGNETLLYNKDMNFSYRHSILQDKKLILVKAMFKVKKGNKSEIKALMLELAEKRKSKQPLEYPSVGSFFKRPDGYFAAKLIEEAGLKGYTVGGAKVSEKHSGFVINVGKATTADILQLSKHIKDTVFEKFGVMLEEEAMFIE